MRGVGSPAAVRSIACRNCAFTRLTGIVDRNSTSPSPQDHATGKEAGVLADSRRSSNVYSSQIPWPRVGWVLACAAILGLGEVARGQDADAASPRPRMAAQASTQ